MVGGEEMSWYVAPGRGNDVDPSQAAPGRGGVLVRPDRQTDRQTDGLTHHLYFTYKPIGAALRSVSSCSSVAVGYGMVGLHCAGVYVCSLSPGHMM